MTRALSSSLLTWLRCFDAAVQHGSFTRAAVELNVTQGSVSQQVKKLEEYLGGELFVRGNRQLSLTNSGKELAEVTHHSFSVLRQTIERLRLDGQGLNSFRLSCSPSFAMMWLTPRISHFLRSYPQLSVRIQGEFHYIDRFSMEKEDVQAGIRFDPGGYKNTRAKEFLDEWLIPVCSPSFLSQHPELNQEQSIAAGYLLHDASPWENAPLEVEWDYWLKTAGYRLNKGGGAGLHFNLSQLALSAAYSDQGLAIGRFALVAEDLKAGRLVAPFPYIVNSPAKYHFLSGNNQSKSSLLLEHWLFEQAELFKLERSRLLKQLSLTRLE